MEISAHIRAIESRFPALVDAKAGFERFLRRTLRTAYPPEFDLLARWRPEPGEAFVDGGANRGQSIDAIRLHQPDAPIYAFEPNPHLAGGLARVYEADAALAVYACGLAEREATRRLFIPVYRGFVYDGLSSFDETDCRAQLNADTVAGFDPGAVEMMACDAKVFALDQVAPEVGFLRLDLHGADHLALEGAWETLARCRPLVLASNDERADAFLTRALGWTRAAWRGGRLVADAFGKFNSFYVPRARLTGLQAAGVLG